MEARKEDFTAAVVRRNKIRRRKIMSYVVVALLVVGVVFFVASRSKKKDPLADMITAKVETTTISQKISATGNVTAQTGASVKIGSQITGRIKHLFTDVGKHIDAGETIAELDLPDIKAQLDQAQANLSAARMRLAEQQSGVGLQRINTSTGITKANADLASARSAYDQAVRNANLEISTAKAAVTLAQANARNAVSQLKRNQQLLSKGYIAQQDVDNSQTQADVAQAQLDSSQQNLNLTNIKVHNDAITALNTVTAAQAVRTAALAGRAGDIIKDQSVLEAQDAVRQAQAQVQVAQAQFAKTIIQTPISGTVIQLAAQQGETLAAGLSAPTLIIVTDLNRLQVDAFVDETDIANVHLGQDAEVTVDAYPNKKFHGRVTKIASGSTMQQNVVTYDTTIALDNPGGLLKPDMTATADIIVGKRENVLAVPIEAVKAGKKGQEVYLVRGKSVTERQVVTGASDDTMTEIKKGVKEGNTVVLAGYDPTQAQRGGGNRNPFMGGGRGRGGRGGGGPK